MFDALVIGGGAAGFFGAVHIAEQNRKLKVAILERGSEVLTKVKVSGGGRCNVAHAEFVPSSLSQNYPRGEKELLGPFHHFASGDTMKFFEDRGVPLKIEDDGRIFPRSDSSQSIIDCLVGAARELGVHTILNAAVKNLAFQKEMGLWKVETKNETYQARKILLTTGSNIKIWHLLARLGHNLVPPVPSLFTFNIHDERLKNLQGISSRASLDIHLPKSRAYDRRAAVSFHAEGPLLITHWGISGPAVLRLSAWGARHLNEEHYKFDILVNWVPDYHEAAVLKLLEKIKSVEARKTVLRTNGFELPKRLWARLVAASGIGSDQKWADLSKSQMQELGNQLTSGKFRVHGKSTFKEEFVTAGGVDLKEVDFRTFQSKLLPGLYFAGEVLNIDAITGGFNFQNAWTGAHLAARDIASTLSSE